VHVHGGVDALDDDEDDECLVVTSALTSADVSLTSGSRRVMSRFSLVKFFLPRLCPKIPRKQGRKRWSIFTTPGAMWNGVKMCGKGYHVRS
jgi:hypothetical protein